jgi:hypothetical protein
MLKQMQSASQKRLLDSLEAKDVEATKRKVPDHTMPVCSHLVWLGVGGGLCCGLTLDWTPDLTLT